MLPVLLSTSNAIGLFFLILFLIPVAFFIVLVIANAKIVEQGTAIVIERYGKFHRRGDAGFHFLIPFVDKLRSVTWRFTQTSVNMRGAQSVKVFQQQVTRIDLREALYDFPNQSAITRDNVELQVHPMLLYRLKDPVRVAYETFDLSHAVEKLVQTTLRSIIGDMGLDDTLASREEIERLLLGKIKSICLNWGLLITAVDLLEITPTPSVQASMHKQLGAERMRRAAIVTADGVREQVKTEAEGECLASIAKAKGESRATELKAKGKAEARVIVARAEAEAVRTISSALSEFGVNGAHYMMGLKYLQTFRIIALNAQRRTVYLPYEADLVGAVAAPAVAPTH